MKLTCPNDKTHNRFMTEALEKWEWVLDENGEKKGASLIDVEVLPEDMEDNYFVCVMCAANAIISE